MSGILQTLIASIGSAITDTYFNLVTLLLPGNGTNGAQNNTFLDSSTNNFTITRNGNTTQGTFSPFSQTGWSNYFDGSSNLNLSTQAVLNVGTGNFTFECFAYFPNVSSSYSRNQIFGPTEATSSSGLTVELSGATQGSNGIKVSISGTTVITYTTAIPANTWNHIAVVREGTGSNQVKLYVNGTNVASGTSSGNLSTPNYNIGRLQANNSTFDDYYTGYLSNIRITNTAVYTAAFTPPTTPLTAVSGTSLLTCQSNRFVDNSTNSFTLTANGTPSVQAFSPFAPTAAYSAATVGGSGYFDGTGDSLTVPDNAAFDLGSGAFTVEAWVYYTATNNYGIVCGQWGGVAVTGASAWIIRQDNASKFQFVYTTNGTTETSLTATNAFSLNTWNHVVACRDSSNNWALFMNGVRQATSTASATIFNSTYSFSIGGAQNTTDLMTGYVSNVRVVKGTAVYDPTQTTLTIPTAPLTAITNTSLLLNYTNAGITDATAKNVLETVGNAQISTTQSKFGGSSMYFDGTGDWVFVRPPTSDLFAFGTGDFTLECWVYVTTVSPTYQVIWDARTTDPSLGAHLVINSGKMTWWLNGASRIQDASSLSINTWYHVAVARSGTSTKMFINGTQVGSTYTDSNSYISRSVPVIGASFDAVPVNPLFGYIDDFRITKGYARYTSNFTAPTAAFALQ